MRQSLIEELLSTFSPGERKAFAHFLDRPERKVRTDVRQFARQLLTGKKDKRTGANQSTNQLASWLYAEARAFLLEKLFRAEGTELPLVTEFDRRKLPRHRDRLIRSLEKNLQDPADRHELAATVYNTTLRRNRTADTNLQEISDLLDRNFLRQKLREACLMQSHENVFQVNYDTGMLPLVLAYVRERELTGLTDIGIYYYAYHFLSDPEAASDFATFQGLLPYLPTWLSDEERRDLYLLGINFCIRQSNRGDMGMAREALRLYREGLTGGALLENGRLTAFTYRNAVALSLKIGDFAWAEHFIEHYATYLPHEQRDNLVHYNRARLAYARGDQERAMEEIRFVTSPDTLFTLTLDTLRAKIYYETGAHELLDTHLDKMQVFLRRRGASYHHRNYANFIAHLKRTLYLPPGQKKRRLLRAAIIDEKELTERQWLLGIISGD
ncbi:MAG: hypothetical protein AAFN92_05730 [Bacteroidota bacterium]